MTTSSNPQDITIKKHGLLAIGENEKESARTEALRLFGIYQKDPIESNLLAWRAADEHFVDITVAIARAKLLLLDRLADKIKEMHT